MSSIKPYQDWLAELESLKRSQDSDGMSTRELCDLWKCDVKTAYRRIREGLSKGAFTLGKKYIEKIDGVKLPIVVYCLKGKKK